MPDGAGGGTALITGLTGQDGFYLSELLIKHGLTVHGVLPPPGQQQEKPRSDVQAHNVDLSCPERVASLIARIEPDYVFHLAGVSSVAASWEDPVETMRVNALSVTAVLDGCHKFQDATGKSVSVVNASSGEIFAGSPESPQTEATPINPTSPYGASKALGHMVCQIYRNRGVPAANAILYNHESPRRPATFVTRKITTAVAAIAVGRRQRFTLGDMTVRRDWGWAPDYVDAMYRIARNGTGQDFVIATGVAHSIAEFVSAAFAAVGIDDWRTYVQTDESLLRPAETPDMVGDPSKARAMLGWEPTMRFDQLVAAMVHSDLDEAIRYD
jgi:GDPmannose 4,6-dehydratase